MTHNILSAWLSYAANGIQIAGTVAAVTAMLHRRHRNRRNGGHTQTHPEDSATSSQPDDAHNEGQEADRRS
jgi:hypothetical protein